MAAPKSIAARARRATPRKPAVKVELDELLGEFNEALSLLRTVTMAFVRAEEHREEFYGAQIASLELAVKIFKRLYTRYDLATMRVQR